MYLCYIIIVFVCVLFFDIKMEVGFNYSVEYYIFEYCLKVKILKFILGYENNW